MKRTKPQTYDRPTLPPFHAAPVLIQELQGHLESIRTHICNVAFDGEPEDKARLYDACTDVEFALDELDSLSQLVDAEIEKSKPESAVQQ